MSPSGRRVIQPYLLLEFASFSLDTLATLPMHEETRGCPFDFCSDVHDIDEVFRVGKICAEHRDFLQNQMDKDLSTKEQFDSSISLFNRALGKIAMKSGETASKKHKPKIEYHFSEVSNSSIIINSPSAIASVDIAAETKNIISELIAIFQSAKFEDEKYKQQSFEILNSILNEVQKPEPKRMSIDSMISILISLTSLATSIDKIAPTLLENIKLFWK